MSDLHNRRVFLQAAVAASAAWVVADMAHVEEALAWAGQQMAMAQAERRDAGVLTKEQFAVIDALAARILPSAEGRPGAHEAGAVYFIDRSLATFNGAQRKLYADGVEELNRRAALVRRGARHFASLPPAQQDQVLREIEKSPFFQAARFDTIVGTFALPTWGGNRGYLGWQMLGMSHEMRFEPPFGFYDADVNRRSK